MRKGLTFDDVCLVPRYNNINSRTEPDLSTWLTRKIQVGIPLVPANMDTVIGSELAEVLVEDLRLKKRRDELLKKIKAVKSENEKKKLVAELEEVVAGRFDLIVRRKQIAYERLLRWLEELRKRIRESRGEIVRWRDDKLKNENVKKRTQDLIGETPTEFRWD